MMQRATVSFCNAVWRLAAINLTAIALVVAGLGLLGLAPAIAACLWAASRPDDRSVRQLVVGMRLEWRAELVRANLALLPPACLLAATLAILPRVHGPTLAVAIGVAAVTSAFALATLYVVSQVRCSVRDTLGNAGRLCAASPLRLLGALAAVAALCLVTLSQPLFGLYGLFAMSAHAGIASLGAMHDPARRVLSLDGRPQENPA